MSIKQFSLEELSLLENGTAVAAFDKHLTRIAQDCADRPGDTAARKVTLSVTMVPVVASGDLNCTRVEAMFHVESKLPPHRTNPVSLGLRHNGMLTFNEDSPDNIDQATFLHDEEESR